MKASGLQYLAHEHQAGAVPDQQLDPVRPLRAEDEDHTREGFESEFMLDQRRPTDGTFPEVDRLCGHPHLERPWRDAGSEERSGGKECVRSCGSRLSEDSLIKKKNTKN